MSIEVNEELQRKLVAQAFSENPHIKFSFKALTGGLSQLTAMLTLEPETDSAVSYVVSMGEGEEYRDRTARGLKTKALLASHELPVARSIGGLQRLEGTNHYFHVAEFVHGTHTRSMTSEQAEALGETLGRIHAIPLPKEKAKEFTPKNLYSNKSMACMQYGKLLTYGLPRGLIHGDANGMNFLFDQETNTVNAMLDFEFSKYGFPVREMVYAAYYLCGNADSPEINIESLHSFFRGYAKVRAPSPKEIKIFGTLLQEFAKELPDKIKDASRSANIDINTICSRATLIPQQFSHMTPQEITGLSPHAQSKTPFSRGR